MKNNAVKNLIIYVAAVIIWSAVISSGLILNMYFESDGSDWRSWSFLLFFDFSFALYCIEELSFRLVKKQKYLFRAVAIALLAAEFALAVFILTLKLTSDYLILIIIICLAFAAALVISGIFCAKRGDIAEGLSKNDYKNSFDYYFSYCTKNLYKRQGLTARKIIFSLICLTAVYVLAVAAMVYGGVVNESVSAFSVALVCVLSFLAVVLNQVQIVFTSEKIFSSTLSENGLLAAALAVYFISEWIWYPVTINFMLLIICAAITFPVHFKYDWLCKEYDKIRKRNS